MFLENVTKQLGLLLCYAKFRWRVRALQPLVIRAQALFLTHPATSPISADAIGRCSWGQVTQAS